ncbi:hypothetical protein OAE59_01015, partial [Synechococcus sp. AH-551-B05]
LKPDNPDAHMNLGGIYKDLGQLDQALDRAARDLCINFLDLYKHRDHLGLLLLLSCKGELLLPSFLSFYKLHPSLRI